MLSSSSSSSSAAAPTPSAASSAAARSPGAGIAGRVRGRRRRAAASTASASTVSAASATRRPPRATVVFDLERCSGPVAPPSSAGLPPSAPRPAAPRSAPSDRKAPAVPPASAASRDDSEPSSSVARKPAPGATRRCPAEAVPRGDGLLRFLRPRRSAPGGEGKGGGGEGGSEGGRREELRDPMFPPVAFSDAAYSRGLLVPVSSEADGGNEAEGAGEGEGEVEEAALPVPRDYFAPRWPGPHDPDGSSYDSDDYTDSRPGEGENYRYGPRTDRPAAEGRRLSPALSPAEARAWAHKHAGRSAAARRYPMEATRLLGAIALRFEERLEGGSAADARRRKGGKNGKGEEEATLDDVGLFAQAEAYETRAKQTPPSEAGPRPASKDYDKFGLSISKGRALAEALSEEGYDEGTDLSSLPPIVRKMVEARAGTIRAFWDGVKGSTSLGEGWDERWGGFKREALGRDGGGGEGEVGERHVPLPVLRSWLDGDGAAGGGGGKKRKRGGKATGKATGIARAVATDLQAGRSASLYGGLRSVPTDARSVLAALADLACPRFLYKVPLAMPYAVAKVTKDDGAVREWRVRIGVYANRLLFEVLTAEAVHVVMSAMDEGSYVVSEPLRVLSVPKEPVFQSAKYPVVRMLEEEAIDVDAGDEVIELDDDSVQEEKKEEDDADGVAGVEGCSRESSTVSPFTPRGLLKVLENTGNDVSSWPAISRSLAPYLKLDLMLHQRHAVCWMTQMENLGGFGINSVLWEERAFLDGGHYYYSPALGQLRLGRPPATVGGCVADEMGLGKTLQCLALIASTLEELKREAREDASGRRTHCTLIIVPPALAVQWRNEIEKSCGTSLAVSMLDARCRVVEPEVVGVLPGGTGCDVLITTYAALERPPTGKYLAGIRWGRIVLDEQQEIRSSTTKVARACERLDCPRRWMMSGTPIFEGIEDLSGELDFLRVEPFAASRSDGFFEFAVSNHWVRRSRRGLDTLRILGLLILRRAKDMTIRGTGAPIMDRKKLTVECVPVAQEASERALYCFVEYIVSRELKQKEGASARDLKSRALCLRMLRQMCFSAVLMNGGVGVPSQLRTLNTLMIKINRDIVSENNRRFNSPGGRRKRHEARRVMGCDEALRFLSQVQREANVREDFVTDVVVGQGQAAASRDHATDSAEAQIKAATEELASATKAQAEAQRKRAKSRWHLALELVTTGYVDEYNGVNAKWSSLWKWKWLCINMKQHEKRDGITSAQRLPQYLQRGWRPCHSFSRDVERSNPGFAWIHPYALKMDNIPPQLTSEELQAAAFEASKKQTKMSAMVKSLSKRVEGAKEPVKSHILSELAIAEESLEDAIAHDEKLKPPTVVIIADANSSSNSGRTWRAFIQFQDGEVFQRTIRAAESSLGIPARSKEEIPHVQKQLEIAREAFDCAESQSKVYPCVANKRLEADARKTLEAAKLGLRMRFGEAASFSSSSGDVFVTQALGFLRGQAPRTSRAMIDSSYSTVARSTEQLEMTAARIAKAEQTLDRLKASLGKNCSRNASTAFEILEALSEGKFDETSCAICLGSLGGSMSSRSAAEPAIAMLSCGHFYCVCCVEEHIQSRIGENQQIQCPTCRRGVSPVDLILIDHTKNDDEEQNAMRKEAKDQIHEARKLLESSDGIITGDLWHSLFLAIDVPLHVSNRGDQAFTAVPRNFCAHLRAATGMRIGCRPADMPHSNLEQQSHQHLDVALSSKVKALLGDLPFGEHAVVFSSSKEGVLHLSAVLKAKHISCFSLYVGQKAAATEASVSSWQTLETNLNTKGPVLVVQAGAAASGLTLTKASKMFLMEPFSRQEEEQQAYARCHRYGQQNDVHVKIYYAPVSVESRLLCWRQRAEERMADVGRSNYVFKELFEEENDVSDVEDDIVDLLKEEEDYKAEKGNSEGGQNESTTEDCRRTQFLLGLVDEQGNPIGVEAKESTDGTL
ncbi:hypothetical protein ACHAWF_010744 [Thalassiosira exigua]